MAQTKCKIDIEMLLVSSVGDGKFKNTFFCKKGGNFFLFLFLKSRVTWTCTCHIPKILSLILNWTLFRNQQIQGNYDSYMTNYCQYLHYSKYRAFKQLQLIIKKIFIMLLSFSKEKGVAENIFFQIFLRNSMYYSMYLQLTHYLT